METYNSANDYLGYSYFITGDCVKKATKHTIGFPTANLKIEENINIPQNGVYLVQAIINFNPFKHDEYRYKSYQEGKNSQ
jgi:FAD synthase